MQLQADAIGVPVEAAGADATVLGSAVLAAVGSGTIGSLAEAAELLPVDRTVEPQRDDAWRAAEHERWRAFVLGAAELSARRVPPAGRPRAARPRRLVDLLDAHALVELDRPDGALCSACSCPTTQAMVMAITSTPITSGVKLAAFQSKSSSHHTAAGP